MYPRSVKDGARLIGRMRSFNRFYTGLIGLLDRHFLESPYSHTEVRVLYEIRHTPDCSAKKIKAAMDIDAGYLSRIIEAFIKRGILRKSSSAQDGRLHIIELTRKGAETFARLDKGSDRSIAEILEKLSEGEREELASLMERIREILKGERDE